MSRYASEAEKAEVHNFTSRSEQALHKRFREQLAQWKDDSPEAIEHREKMQATARPMLLSGQLPKSFARSRSSLA
jgi:hypothetical protein